MPEPGVGRTGVQVRTLRTLEAFRARVAELGVELPLPGGTHQAVQRLREPISVAGRPVGNRFAILPMEGWDATPDGRPTDLVTRRWRRFGESGAKLIWGGEAVAVEHAGRANPNQLRIGADTVGDLAALREELVAAHRAAHGGVDDLLVGLQLTHSGRYARPDGVARPRPACANPLLDARVGSTAADVLTDGELDSLVERFVEAARLSAEAGFAFVDVKQCHGYLGHELLGAVDRPGRYGGDFEGRTRFVREILAGVRAEVPELGLGVRLSTFDLVPFEPGADGVGRPASDGPYPYAFGGDGQGLGVDLDESHRLVDELVALGVSTICVTAGSPYTTPHIQRPAYFPPSDGYLPPHDPLIDVARLLDASRALVRRHPGVVVVASGFSYLQEWVGAVAEAAVADGWAHLIGLGRMALSYPTLPADVLADRPLDRRLLCRTFSDCTTAPRNGLVSGCYPLDPFYKSRPERVDLAAAKRRARRDRPSRDAR